MSGQETIASRFVKLNQIILGKSGINLPNKYLAHRDGLLDVLFALFEECNVDYMRKDKHVAAFVDKYKGLMVELKSLRVNFRDFEVKKIIGRGHFGEVQVVREKATGDVYAMKTLRKEDTLSQQSVAFYKEERDIMSISSSPWLTKLQYAFQDAQNLYLVMEFHPGGDMLSLLEKYDNALPEDMCQFYLAELVLAIHSLHHMGYVHRDIKPDNILIDRTGHIKLADFGSASKLNPHKKVSSNMPVGTPDYVAPEVLAAMNPGPVSSRSYGIECDWWSLGVVAYEMVFGSTPFADEKVLITYNNIMNFKHSLKFPPEAEEVSTALISFIKDLLKDATSRLGYDQLVVHPYFTDIDWNNIHHIAPPYVPTVTSGDDTSNFDEFEPESRPYIRDFGKKEFTGKNLPFLGFTYTAPFQMNTERLSSIDESSILSPTSSFCETDSSYKRKEIVALQSKISMMASAEESLKKEINKLKQVSENKDKEIDKIKDEKVVMDQIVKELRAEVQQVKQLLSYEREHRVITEQKAAQLVRCMKTKHKQDALRLRAKSLELNRGEGESSNLEERLEEALSKIDDFVSERAELLDDLEATKHSLLQIQQKLKEKEMNTSALTLDTPRRTSMNLNNSQNTKLDDSKAEGGIEAYKRLIMKLEKKNVELEKDLENALSSKNEKELSNIALQNTVCQLEEKIIELSNQSSLVEPNLTNESTVGTSLSHSVEECYTSDSKRDTITESSGFSDDAKSDIQDTGLKCAQVQLNVADYTSEVVKKNCLSLAPIQRVDIPSEKLETTEFTPVHKKSSNEDSNGSPVSLEDKSDLKQEIEYMKSRIEVLGADASRLLAELKDMENLNLDLKTQLKEKEASLSEAKLDLRISNRKEQQTDSITSSLRDRNKELREKIKSLEETLNEKIKAEDELKDKVSNLEIQLSKAMKEADDKQKRVEIERAKYEERIKAMQYTCEMSKDVTQKFAKSQDHYEEIVKQNMELIREKEENNRTILCLEDEITKLKNEMTHIKNEKARFEKMSSVLKSCCMELQEQTKDLEIIVEARQRAIRDLQEYEDNLIVEIKGLKESMKVSKAETNKAEKKCEELMKHIEELNSELDNNNLLAETEVQNLQDQLSHYKKATTEIEEQNAALQKELILQNSDIKNYSEKIMNLESQLYEIKEEAARHITQISSLKSSNLKLTQSLEEALEQNKMDRQDYENLLNELDGIKAVHHHEKVKMQETIAQQTKLIDFLQSKTENIEKRRKPNIARLFGKKDNASNIMPMQYRDVEKLLETEKSRCRRLQDQLSQARAETVALKSEIKNIKNSTLNIEVPVSPVSRAMHCVIAQSPSRDSTTESPVLVSKELMSKYPKPPGMKHKIPHRFTNILCMRSSKCCACLDTLHFGRPVSKCQECSIICHTVCSSSLPNTCGLPYGIMDYFRKSVNSSSNSDSIESSKNISEGWIKLPKNNKLGWDNRYLRIIDNMLCFFENDNETDSEKALIKLNFSPEVARIVVTSAVSPTELTFAASSDLPFVLKLEYIPHTTCWPQRCLYIMTKNFDVKQKWVSTLEALAEENQTEIDSCQKSKLIGKTLWTMKGERLIDPLCTCLLDDNIILLGAMDGLYVLKIVNKFTCSLKSKVDGLQHVYQINCVKNIGLVILIQGNERRITTSQLSSVQSAVQKLGNSSLVSKPLCDISDCHLFAVDSYHSETPYICIATSKSVLLLQWDTVLKMFCNKKVFNTKEPCSCIHFTPNSVIFGADCFYQLDLSTYALKNFLDDKDASLAGLIYGASQFRSFPVAIFLISSPHQPAEYLMCFHEMGVFVNNNGQRTRSDDMKWSRLPLSFAYHLPYLFVTHFNSIEVVEIPPQGVIEPGLQGVTLVQNPQYLGPAHLDQSVYLSSCHDQIIELLLIDGNSIGKSEFNLQLQNHNAHSSESCSTSSSGKESIPESEGLDFSFSTSIDQSLAEFSVDQISVSSRTSSASESTSPN